MAIAVLSRSEVQAQACATMAQLVEELARGAGALMLTEEVLSEPALGTLTDALAAQPPWSDIPVLLLARQGADSRAVSTVMDRLANVTIIERPVRVASLVSAVRSTLRARRRQYELRTVLDGLRESDQRKTEFLATLAHELRNPLAPISTALALLMRHAPPPAEAARAHALMRRQVDHMVRLVDDLMEMSRITRGKVALKRLPVRLDAPIADAIELSRPLVEHAGHRLTVDLSGADRLTVRGDAVRLTQVFSNLLNNAAKYTPPGGRLHVAARREGREAVVDVVDSGAGLSAQMLEPIFDMFVQFGDSAKGAQGGLGIGLTLVKSLVELHGGRVQAASNGPDQGSTFTVRLPLVAAPAAQEKAAAVEAPPDAPVQRHVLVVDDNRDAADSLAELLRSMGATVEVVYSGRDALRLFDDAGGDALDAAVLDIGMPEQDGCALALELRRRPGGGALKLIALTGWGQERDRARIAAAGFDHHLLKPVDAGVLRELLSA
jgi:signal transduction histidine kinase/CheY-like chemotaxis protein